MPDNTPKAAARGGWGKCTVCASPHRADVEAAVIGGMPLLTAATQHGLKRSAVYNHMQKHAAHDLTALPAAGTGDHSTAGEALAEAERTARQLLKHATTANQRLDAAKLLTSVA